MKKPKYSKILKEFRKYLELTQYQMGHKLGISEGAVCHYETGFRRPHHKVQRKIIKMGAKYGFNIDYEMLNC